MNSEEMQKNHFDNIILEYEKHYHDKYSNKYKEKYVFPYLFKGVDLNGKKVLEAMCGSGQATEYLISMGADVVCLDLSKVAINRLKEKFPKVNTACSSMKDTNFDSNYFDIVVVMGGLHHVQPEIYKSINEILRILKKDGVLCFFEPHTGSFIDIFRKYWYKHDAKYIKKNEASINVINLKKNFKNNFNFISEYYSGNLAYLFVYNSLIFRILLKYKKYYSPILIFFESIINHFQSKLTSCFVICQWKKK